MKKALFVCNMDSFHRNFNQPYVRRLNEHGYEVDLACVGDEDFPNIRNKFDVQFARRPFKAQNISALKQLRKIVRDCNYDLIYASTPVPGALVRLALIGTKHGRVVYSAHGFNFYKGNGKISNLIFIILEKFLSLLTDCVFTMNQEDYTNGKKYMSCKELYNVDGVGVDTSIFSRPTADEKSAMRKKFGYNDNQFLLIYPADFHDRKNQKLLIDAVAILSKTVKNIKLLLPGTPWKDAEYRAHAKKLGVEQHVDFLGYRRDIKDILKMTDVLFASSINEGLPINIIEGLATGLPIVATRVRGHVDLIEDGKNGFLFDLGDPQSASDCIEKLVGDKELYNRMSDAALISAKKYDLSVVVPQYDKVFGI